MNKQDIHCYRVEHEVRIKTIKGEHLNCGDEANGHQTLCSTASDARSL